MTDKSPVERVIEAFGGVKKLAAAANQPLHRIYRWRQKRETGGGGGVIPADAQGPILTAARDLGIPLVAEDLIDMRPAPVTEGAS